MTRRTALTSMTGLLLGGVAFALGGDAPAVTYGYLSVDSCWGRGIHPAHVKVFLNGQPFGHGPDTNKALACDDRAGWVETFARDAQGRMYPGRDGKLVRVRHYGRITVTVDA
jgi:hypothetical protein